MATRHGTVLDEASRRALQRLARETGEDPSVFDAVVPEPAEPAEVPESWTGYAGYLLWRAATSTLGVLDAAGEWLAATLGITTPRYQHVIDDLIAAQREADEEEEALAEQEAELNAERDAAVVRMEAVPEAAAASIESTA